MTGLSDRLGAGAEGARLGVRIPPAGPAAPGEGTVRIAGAEPGADRAGARRRLERVLSVATPIGLLLAWEAGVHLGVVDRRYFPAPSEVLAAGWAMILDGSLALHAAASVQRAFIGFLMGAVPGALLGVAIGLNRYVRAALQPIVDAVYPIPKLAIMPLILLIFGLGELSKWVIVASGVFFQLVIVATAGVMNIERIYFDVGRNYRAGRWDFFRTVVLPGALPVIYAGVRIGWGIALLLVIAAEIVASRTGLGFLIWQSWQIFRIEAMYVGLTSIAVIALGSFAILGAIERVLFRWRPPQARG